MNEQANKTNINSNFNNYLLTIVKQTSGFF